MATQNSMVPIYRYDMILCLSSTLFTTTAATFLDWDSALVLPCTGRMPLNEFSRLSRRVLPRCIKTKTHWVKVSRLSGKLRSMLSVTTKLNLFLEIRRSNINHYKSLDWLTSISSSYMTLLHTKMRVD